MRTIFHIDVNSAYLSWTSVENLKTGNGPDLREIPAIIGGDQKTRHGVVLAKSIPAKKFGIHTGEPVVNALKKCPNLVMAPPNHDLYHAYSRRMMDFLHSLTPDIEQVSIDECFLDFTGISHRYPSPYAAARYIKDEIHSRFGFTVNVGISSNKLLAKMASDFEKPDKIHTLFPDEIPQKMWPLPIGELFMAGKSSVKALNNPINDGKKIFLVVERVIDAESIFNQLNNKFNRLNIGTAGVKKQPGQEYRPTLPQVHVSRADYEAAERLDAQGVKVFAQVTPTREKMDFAEIKKVFA